MRNHRRTPPSPRLSDADAIREKEANAVPEVVRTFIVRVHTTTVVDYKVEATDPETARLLVERGATKDIDRHHGAVLTTVTTTAEIIPITRD